ncbi:hypothetical protein LJC02_04045, partial [Breznakia sp. OttesenSCG-928-G09]|nr:hypothetical protein [Breznakia sp. OttesenSCG-928-G09]
LISTIKTEIENMPNTLVQVAQLRYFEDFTTREISEIMDIPEGTVKTRLNKVRKIIQPKLDTKGFSPAKYFSFAFTPIMFSAFQQIIDSHTLSNAVANKMFENMSVAIGGAAGLAASAGAAAGSAGAGASNASNGLLTAAKVAVAAVAGGSGVYGVYNVVQSTGPNVEQISYYNEITNKDIEVEVILSKKENEEDIKILYNGNDVTFTAEDKTLTFVAKANGEYVVEVGGTQNIFTISNIDKQSPELISVEKSGNSVVFSYNDDVSGIDFEKSYITVSTGEKISLPTNNVINGDYSGSIKVNLYDKAGNVAEYEVDLDA